MSERRGGFDVDAFAAALGPLQEQIESVAERIGALELRAREQPETALLQQLHGQVGSVERALLEHRQALVTLDQRITGLHAQIANYNVRYASLDLAIKAKATTATAAVTSQGPGAVVVVAQAFFDFLSAPMPSGGVIVSTKPNGHDAGESAAFDDDSDVRH